MTTTVVAKIELRKGTAAQWTSANPTLAVGEIGYETDTKKQKIGDGVSAWTALAYYYNPAQVHITDHGDLTGLADDTHLQYHTNARGDARYSVLGHDHAGIYELANSNLQGHVSSTSNPHSTTAAQVGADASGTASGLIASHEASSNPHPVYLTQAEGDTAYSALAHTHSGVYEPAGTVSTHAAGTSVHAIASVTGLQTALDSKSATSHDHAATYAPIAKGVTNGDSHDHNGGDGGQIAYSALSGLPTLGTAAAQNTGAFEASGAIATHSALTTTHGISSFGASLVDDADASTARATLGLGTAATTASGDYATAAQGAKADTAYQPGSIASVTHAATEKATPVDADELPLVDSAASFLLKKLTWANLKTTLQSVFATLAGKSGGQTLIGGTGVTDKLVLQGTSGNGTGTSAAIEFKVGNNGSVVSNIENCGRVNIIGNTNDNTEALLKISNSYSASFIPLMEFLSPNMTATQSGYFAFGLSASAKNRASISFYYAGSGSDNNYMEVGGFFGVSNRGIRCYADGRIQLPNTGTTPKLQITNTTEQLRLGYDASYYASFTVSSAGNLTITPIGGSLNVGTLDATSILTQSQVLSAVQFGAL